MVPGVQSTVIDNDILVLSVDSVILETAGAGKLVRLTSALRRDETWDNHQPHSKRLFGTLCAIVPSVSVHWYALHQRPKPESEVANFRFAH
jgi:hypothetical protein